jgi:hypothetical protein
LRQSGFGLSENNQLQKSIASLTKNIQLLATPGSEGDLELASFPINLFCLEMFGGNCHTLCSFNVDVIAVSKYRPIQCQKKI